MELWASPMPNAGTLQLHFLGTWIVYVCADDIDSLHSVMQIFIDRVYMGKDMDKQDKTRTPPSSLIIANI